MSLRWPNRETREAYIHTLEEWEDPLGFAKEWLDIGADSAGELLAKQLRKDYREMYTISGDDLADALIDLGLRRVDWRYVAERLLLNVERAAEQEESEAGGTAEPSA
jgi:hypothetical protein